MNLGSYIESAEKQKGGAPIYIEDATFFARRYGTHESNKIVKSISRRLFGPFHKSQPEDNDLIFAHWLVEYGIIGWENVYNPDGSLLEYSEHNARLTFLNPEIFLSLNKLIYFELNNFENFLYDSLEEDIEDIKKP